MSEAAPVTTDAPETLGRALRSLGCTPSWRHSCQIRPDRFNGFQVLSPCGDWAWSAQVNEWCDAKRDDLGSFTKYEWAARALAACTVPPPGIAEAERQAFGLGQRAWLVNRATNLNALASGIEDLARDPEGIKIALARPGHPDELELGPIQTLVRNATRVIDACGRIASAARAAFGGLGTALEGHNVMAGDDVCGVGIPLVDVEASHVPHGGAEGNPQGRTDAPAASCVDHLKTLNPAALERLYRVCKDALEVIEDVDDDANLPPELAEAMDAAVELAESAGAQ